MSLSDSNGNSVWRSGYISGGMTVSQSSTCCGLLDWLVFLPKALEQDFWRSLITYQEEQKMQYVMSIERFAEERGIEKGQVALVLRQLDRKFGTLSDEIRDRIHQLSMNQLEGLGEALLDFDALADLKNWLEQQEEKSSDRTLS